VGVENPPDQERGYRSPSRGVSSSAICEARSTSARVRCSGGPRQSSEDGDTGNDGGDFGRPLPACVSRVAVESALTVHNPYIRACEGNAAKIISIISVVILIRDFAGQSNRTLATSRAY